MIQWFCERRCCENERGHPWGSGIGRKKFGGTPIAISYYDDAYYSFWYAREIMEMWA